MDKVTPQSDAADAATIRRAAEAYRLATNTTFEGLQAEAGLSLDASSFRKFMNKSSGSIGQINKLAKFLVSKNYLVESSVRKYYESISEFFSTHSESYVQQVLQSVEGHYICWQPSTWHRGLVTISHIHIRPLLDSGAHYRDVMEEQYTGDAKQREFLKSIVGEEVIEEHERFRGCCYVCHGSLYITLRNVRHRFAKNIICNDIDADYRYLTGYVQKSTQIRVGNYIHMASLYLERVDKSESVKPRIDAIDHIINEQAVRTIERSIGPAVRRDRKL